MRPTAMSALARIVGEIWYAAVPMIWWNWLSGASASWPRSTPPCTGTTAENGFVHVSESFSFLYCESW